jgi:GNAT superfamily N-acetyltransferase
MNPIIRLMTPDDIPAGMRLKDQNGWNTLPEDWRRQLDLEPDGCFVAELDNQVIGTACACIFETVAWVNLVLVDREHRGRGIGTSLMRTVLAYLDERKIPTIRLDATPLGKPIYHKLGFTVDYELTRWSGFLPRLGFRSNRVQVALGQAPDLPSIAALDRHVTGTNRERLIAYLLQYLTLNIACENGQVVGYSTFRPGSMAQHIGPCLGHPNTCYLLLTAISQALHENLVYIDIPQSNSMSWRSALAWGLRPQRQLTRMTRGPRVQEQLDQYWCSFGPEKG